MKRLQKHMHTSYVYLAVGLFFVLKQLSSLQAIEQTATISSEGNYLLMMTLIVVMLPVVLLVVVYLPSAYIGKLSHRHITLRPTTTKQTYIAYPIIQFHNVKQRKQYSLQVFRC